MNFIRKLRPPEMNIEATIGIAMAPIMAFLFVVFGLSAMFLFVAFVELIGMFVQINLYMRSKNPAFLWMAFAFLIFFVFILDIAIFDLDKYRSEFPILIVGVFMGGGIIMYMVLNKKIKWRTREIFELSAMPVSDTSESFTERPLPSGKIEATPEEIEAFTRFISKNLIAIPYFEKGQVVYSLTSNYWKQIGVRRGYEDESWISVDTEGQVNVFIARQDYQKFKDDLTFDQLCNSLGRLFVEFFEMFRRGDGIKIIHRFNDLRLNPIIE